MDTTKQSGKIDTLDFLPSLNLIYKLNDNMNLRATFTQTLARPNMREMAPFLAEDYIGGFKVQGNPELDRTLVQNYDLRWEWFPNPGELLAASVFYKNFNNPIIMEFPPFVANNDIQIYSNVEEAVVYGVEFEFRKNLGFITPALDKFQFATNFAFIQSNVDMTEDECQSVLDNNPDKGCSRPFYGQSPYLVNANMQYNDDENGWNATASFNIFGERLIVQGPATIPDIYEQPFPQLDLTINKRLTENFSLKLAALNILNADVNQTMEFRGTLYDVLRYQRGSSFSVGISYRL
jgi:TonB-dependent receptor